MKTSTLRSIGGILLASSLALNAQVLQIGSGWQILGASENITNMTAFSSDCVSAIYTYQSDSTGYKMYKPSGTANQITALNAGDGFWIKGLKSCSVDTAGSTANVTPPPQPVATATTTSTTTDTSATDRALYDANCLSCHGSAKLGSSATAISAAIASNTGGMGSLSFLTAAQINSIAAAR